MFSHHLLKYIEKEPESNIKVSYVVDVLSKFCSIGIAKTLSLKQHTKQIEYIDTLLECFEDMQTFELEESQRMLKFIQNGLSKEVAAKPPGKEKVELHMSAAMNTIMQHLEKGREDKDTQKFYAGIEAAVEYLQERKEKLLAAINESANSQENEFKHTASSRFFSPHSTNPPYTKRAKYEKKTDNEEQEALDVDTVQNQKIEL